jgi:hypothetical protein
MTFLYLIAYKAIPYLFALVKAVIRTTHRSNLWKFELSYFNGFIGR